MQHILIPLKLFVLGLYIELTRTILHLVIKYGNFPLSSPKTVFFSGLCNYASTKFVYLEKNYAKLNKKIDIFY